MNQTIRFNYGGHATFPVRYGWLPKGLNQLITTHGFSANTQTADALGLGSKMVDSLGYWLNMTGLRPAKDDEDLEIAKLIFAHDRYFERPGTWWFLHLILARQEGSVWSWFFNDFSDRIFDRITAQDAFQAYARTHAQRPPSAAMVQRDVACLLSAYAARPGVDLVDPEDIGACPFRELGLVARHDAVHRFERTRRPQGLPEEVFLAATSALQSQKGVDRLSLRELATLRLGPGRIFCQGLEAIETTVGKIGKKRQDGVIVESAAGDRTIHVPDRPLTYWLEALYSRVDAEAAG
ncbi:DUF4007 family protein [Caulobacter flavus]|uniref:DUF4007 family protein n=1 Tax=Caulobacter flavus TaxID=1679497 RepID=UPI0013DD9FA2|nr:DUF4007 family protein [Caulobacter flavus]